MWKRIGVLWRSAIATIIMVVGYRLIALQDFNIEKMVGYSFTLWLFFIVISVLSGQKLTKE